MRSLFRATLAALALAPVLASTAPAQDCPLVNGSFETWSGGYTPGNQPDRIFNDLSLVVPGWNFAIGLSSDIYRDLNASGAQSNYYDAYDGDYLVGSGSFPSVNEGVEQTFVVAPSTPYAVTFEMAPGGLNYSGAWIENATIGSGWKVQVTGAVVTPVNQTFNNNLADFDASGTTNPLQWTSHIVLFMSDAVGGNVTLRFTAQGDQTHVFLDDVGVCFYDGPVPAQPSTWSRIKTRFE